MRRTGDSDQREIPQFRVICPTGPFPRRRHAAEGNPAILTRQGMRATLATMKIGFIPPVPIEPFAASRQAAVNLWSRFYLEPERSRWLEGEAAWDSPPTPSAWARCLGGLCEEAGVEAVVVPEPGLIKELRGAVARLEGRGIKVVPFRFPLIRNMSRLRREIQDLGSFLGVEREGLDAALQKWGPVRMALKRLDGIQNRTAAFSTRHYLTTLASAAEPSEDLDNLKKKVDGLILELESLGQDRWTRLGIIGIPPYRKGLFSFLEQFGAVVVYDEWGIETNPMSAAGDLAALYHLMSLPYGLKRRQARILNEIRVRRLKGMLFCVEDISDSLRDEGFFRSGLPVPVHTFENHRGEELEPGEAGALQRFLEQCRAASP